MKNKLAILVFMLLLVPAISLAQVRTSGATSTNCALGSQGGDLEGVLCKVGELLNAVVPVLIALGVVYFVWGVIQYVVGGDEEKKAKGRTAMIYGIIGLVVIIGLWGLVSLVRNTFRLDNSTNIQLPTVPVVPRSN